MDTRRKRPAVLRASMLLLGVMTKSFTVIASAPSSSLNAGPKPGIRECLSLGCHVHHPAPAPQPHLQPQSCPHFHGKVILVRRALQWRSLLHLAILQSEQGIHLLREDCEDHHRLALGAPLTSATSHPWSSDAVDLRCTSVVR